MKKVLLRHASRRSAIIRSNIIDRIIISVGDNQTEGFQLFPERQIWGLAVESHLEGIAFLSRYQLPSVFFLPQGNLEMFVLTQKLVEIVQFRLLLQDRYALLGRMFDVDGRA